MLSNLNFSRNYRADNSVESPSYLVITDDNILHQLNLTGGLLADVKLNQLGNQFCINKSVIQFKEVSN